LTGSRILHKWEDLIRGKGTPEAMGRPSFCSKNVWKRRLEKAKGGIASAGDWDYHKDEESSIISSVKSKGRKE